MESEGPMSWRCICFESCSVSSSHSKSGKSSAAGDKIPYKTALLPEGSVPWQDKEKLQRGVNLCLTIHLSCSEWGRGKQSRNNQE